VKIRFLGHASFIIEEKVKVAIDPFHVSVIEPMDFIFITHSHFDHFSSRDIGKLSGENTLLIGPEGCRKKLEALSGNILPVKPSKEYNPGVRFKTLPAYNKRRPFHLKRKNWVGYLIFLEESVYHPGDTDFLEEMRGLEPDVFFAPVSGFFTMGAKQAAEAVAEIRPKRVIPMHYGKIIGSRKNAEKLKSLSSIPVEILEPEIP